MDYYGYAGNILYVNLTSREVRKEPLDLDMARRFIGGAGVNHKLAYDLIKPKTDALSPENALIFGSGPLAGTLAPGTAKLQVTSKAPLNGVIQTSSAGMGFASVMKYAGYDHIVILGKAAKPVYLKISDDDVEICDAQHLWGTNISEVTNNLTDKYKDSSVIAIGPAGENMVKFAIALVDGIAHMGRGGLGAVMGAKNLKAVVVQGTKGIAIADLKRFMKAINSLHERVRNYPAHQAIVNMGMAFGWEGYLEQMFHYKNFTEIPDGKEITELYGPPLFEELNRKGQRKALGCPSCFVADKEIIKVTDTECEDLELHTSSFTAVGILGVRFGIKDYRQATKLMYLLNEYGLDAQTFASFMDFIIYIYELGIISEKDTDGLTLKRDFNTVNALIEIIAFREGFGNSLADGFSEIINKIDRGCEKYAPIIKGIDFLYDPRVSGIGTLEFQQIVSPRGAFSGTGGSAAFSPGQSLEKFRTHTLRMGATDEAVDRILDTPLGFNAGRLSRYSEDWASVFNSLGICNRNINNRFYSASLCAELYSAATGFELNDQQLMQLSEKSWNLYKALNIREGFDKKDDVIPDRWFEPTKTADGQERMATDYYRTRTVTKSDFEALLDDYYDERGWDKKNGLPTRQKLIDLGLEDVAEDLCREGLLS